MASVSMNIRIQPEIKSQAKEILADYGLDMTTAVNMFFRQIVRTHAVPLDLRPEVPNAETIEAMEEARTISKDINAKRYSSFAAYRQQV
jgi:DNA-damage-inducible protein J